MLDANATVEKLLEELPRIQPNKPSNENGGSGKDDMATRLTGKQLFD